MCGIIGYTGKKNITDELVAGLEKLEYRGYDSAGIAYCEHGKLMAVKAVGRIKELKKLTDGLHPDSTCGIGHTRWATHGKPTIANCHPHLSYGGKFAIVHNGIIENCRQLRLLCESRGISPVSDTDSELIAHLLEMYFEGDLRRTADKVAGMLEGSYAVGVLCSCRPNEIYAFASRSPLVIGQGKNFCALTSDGNALSGAEMLVFLKDGESALLRPSGAEFYRKGKRVALPAEPFSSAASLSGKDGYAHYMLKETYEQPEAAARTITALSGRKLRGALDFIGCGSSYHAGLSMLPLACRASARPAQALLAGEYLCSERVRLRGTTAVLLSQSGETADTVAAAQEAERRSCRTFAIVNVASSTLTRVCDDHAVTRAGPETAVATTKGFTSQIVAVAAMLARGSLADSVERLPFVMEKALASGVSDEAEEAARLLAVSPDAFFIGRKADYGVALEGALKLKEITYIPALGLSAGELKHGSISLISEGTPVVVVHTDPALREKTLLTIASVRARGGFVIAVTDDRDVCTASDLAVRIPSADPYLSPAVSVIPLQLIAYRAAVLLGRDVDKPRNLAKSVTVE